MSNGNLQKRIDYFDIAKGIGILCVILGHMGVASVYVFHMPLFFIISGYFLNESKELSFYIKEKAKQLLIPYLFTNVIVCLLAIPSGIVKNTKELIGEDVVTRVVATLYGVHSSDKTPLDIQGVGPIWFLPALFLGLLIVRF